MGLTSSQTLLFAQLVICWAALIYISAGSYDATGSKYISIRLLKWRSLRAIVARAILGGVLASYFTDWKFVAAIAGTLLILLPLSVRLITNPKYAFESEIGIIAGGISTLYAMVHGLRLSISNGWVELSPANAPKAAALLMFGAMFIFLVSGANLIVRGLLEKAGTFPPNKEGVGVDQAEVKRGKLIGSLERLLLALVIALGSYEAFGFIIAAKGLIRSKDLENHAFGEYFLVGTLSSVLVALVVGEIFKIVWVNYWTTALP